jgi:hypothetical protein
MTVHSWWTEARIDELRFLATGGNSLSHIGDLLGCGKNAVIGKVNRLEKLGLWSIERKRRPAGTATATVVLEMTQQGVSQKLIGDVLGTSRKVAARIQHEIGIGPGHAAKGGVPKGWTAPLPQPVIYATSVPPRQPAPPATTPAPIPTRQGTKQCEWLSGDTKPYTRCAAAHVVGSPYCLHHTIIAMPRWGYRRCEAVA